MKVCTVGSFFCSLFLFSSLASTAFANVVDDTEIRSSDPNESFGNLPTVSANAADGGGFESQGLVKFQSLLTDVTPSLASAVSYFLTIFCTDPSTTFSIVGYRMMASWNESSTWNAFGSNGIIPGIEASSTPSFSVPQPVNGSVSVDVTKDVLAWLGGAMNQGWVFINSNANRWEFASSESESGPALSARASFQLGVDVSISPTFTKICDEGNICVRQSKHEGLLKFPGINIPNGTSLESAELWLFSDKRLSGGVINAHRMTYPWNDDITYDYFGGGNGVKLGLDAKLIPSFTLVPPASGWVKADVTADVAEWLSAASIENQGWVFKSTSDDIWHFRSSDNHDLLLRPFLYISYSAGTDFSLMVYALHSFVTYTRFCHVIF